MSIRDEIDSAVGAVLFNASNYPKSAMPHMLGQDIGPLREKVVEAVLESVQPPTREQIAEAVEPVVRRWFDTGGSLRAMVTDAVFALFPQPTPSAEPGRTLTEAQVRVVGAAIEGLAIHAETCGHRRVHRECPYCDDQATVQAARAALGRAVWGPGEADPADPRWKPPVQPAAEPPSIVKGMRVRYLDGGDERIVGEFVDGAWELLIPGTEKSRMCVEPDVFWQTVEPVAAEPVSIADMAPGTEFFCEGQGVPGVEHHMRVTKDTYRDGTPILWCLTHKYGAAAPYVDPSTIRDVTPPK